MKNVYLLLFSFALFACNNAADKTQALQNRIDSLEKNFLKPINQAWVSL